MLVFACIGLVTGLSVSVPAHDDHMAKLREPLEKLWEEGLKNGPFLKVSHLQQNTTAPEDAATAIDVAATTTDDAATTTDVAASTTDVAASETPISTTVPAGTTTATNVVTGDYDENWHQSSCEKTTSEHNWKDLMGHPCDSYTAPSEKDGSIACSQNTPTKASQDGTEIDIGFYMMFADPTYGSALDNCCGCGKGKDWGQGSYRYPVVPHDPSLDYVGDCKNKEGWMDNDGMRCADYTTHCRNEAPVWQLSFFTDVVDERAETALSACCICGGGIPPPGSGSSHSGLLAPDGSECRDVGGFRDRNNVDCFGYNGRCYKGDLSSAADPDRIYFDARNGLSAAEACCMCGGGTHMAEEMAKKWADSDDGRMWCSDRMDDTCAAFTQSEMCVGGQAKHERYELADYTVSGGLGASALDVCCGCGGGIPTVLEKRTGLGGCMDHPGFLDSVGHTCVEYEGRCMDGKVEVDLTSVQSLAVGGVDATHECCVCGGGEGEMDDFVHQVDTTGQEEICTDSEDYADKNGDDCSASFVQNACHGGRMLPQHMIELEALALDGTFGPAKACCICGGGTITYKQVITTTTTTIAPLGNETVTVRAPDGVNPGIGKTGVDENCKDTAGWHDSADELCAAYTSRYDCHDGAPSHANSYYAGLGVHQVSALWACCQCGGGLTPEEIRKKQLAGEKHNGIHSDISQASEHLPSDHPHNAIPEGKPLNGAECKDIDASWSDIDGHTCGGYSKFCHDGVPAATTYHFETRIGNEEKDGGMTALDNCCQCGGGTRIESKAIHKCKDHPGWMDIFGKSCGEYDGDYCSDGMHLKATALFHEVAALDGTTGADACCVCGGGTHETIHPDGWGAPVNGSVVDDPMDRKYLYGGAVKANCVDMMSWKDSNGDGCGTYVDRCKADDVNAVVQNLIGPNGFTAMDACCVCGGGHETLETATGGTVAPTGCVVVLPDGGILACGEACHIDTRQLEPRRRDWAQVSPTGKCVEGSEFCIHLILPEISPFVDVTGQIDIDERGAFCEHGNEEVFLAPPSPPEALANAATALPPGAGIVNGQVIMKGARASAIYEHVTHGDHIDVGSSKSTIAGGFQVEGLTVGHIDVDLDGVWYEDDNGHRVHMAPPATHAVLSTKQLADMNALLAAKLADARVCKLVVGIDSSYDHLEESSSLNLNLQSAIDAALEKLTVGNVATSLEKMTVNSMYYSKSLMEKQAVAVTPGGLSLMESKVEPGTVIAVNYITSADNWDVLMDTSDESQLVQMLKTYIYVFDEFYGAKISILSIMSTDKNGPGGLAPGHPQDMYLRSPDQSMDWGAIQAYRKRAARKPAPTLSCEDDAWADNDGRQCEYYQENHWCAWGAVKNKFMLDAHLSSGTAAKACCDCGGGHLANLADRKPMNFLHFVGARVDNWVEAPEGTPTEDVNAWLFKPKKSSK